MIEALWAKASDTIANRKNDLIQDAVNAEYTRLLEDELESFKRVSIDAAANSLHECFPGREHRIRRIKALRQIYRSDLKNAKEADDRTGMRE